MLLILPFPLTTPPFLLCPLFQVRQQTEIEANVNGATVEYLRHLSQKMQQSRIDWATRREEDLASRDSDLEQLRASVGGLGLGQLCGVDSLWSVVLGGQALLQWTGPAAVDRSSCRGQALLQWTGPPAVDRPQVQIAHVHMHVLDGVGQGHTHLQNILLCGSDLPACLPVFALLLTTQANHARDMRVLNDMEQKHAAELALKNEREMRVADERDRADLEVGGWPTYGRSLHVHVAGVLIDQPSSHVALRMAGVGMWPEP